MNRKYEKLNLISVVLVNLPMQDKHTFSFSVFSILVKILIKLSKYDAGIPVQNIIITGKYIILAAVY